jgi:uncharacterized protein YcfL
MTTKLTLIISLSALLLVGCGCAYPCTIENIQMEKELMMKCVELGGKPQITGLDEFHCKLVDSSRP